MIAFVTVVKENTEASTITPKGPFLGVIQIITSRATSQHSDLSDLKPVASKGFLSGQLRVCSNRTHLRQLQFPWAPGRYKKVCLTKIAAFY